jgi:hypothetical protein
MLDASERFCVMAEELELTIMSSGDAEAEISHQRYL